MGVQLHVRGLLTALRVNLCQPTVPITYPEATGCGVVTNIAASSFSSTVAVCCSEAPSYKRHEPSLSLATARRLDSGAKPIPWSLEIPDFLRDLARRKIDYLDSVVSESGDEEPFALRI
jgi:hypothetical protein